MRPLHAAATATASRALSSSVREGQTAIRLGLPSSRESQSHSVPTTCAIRRTADSGGVPALRNAATVSRLAHSSQAKNRFSSSSIPEPRHSHESADCEKGQAREPDPEELALDDRDPPLPPELVE